MKRYEIRQRMTDKGVKVTAIARELGISHTAVSKVIHGYGRSRRVESLIAKSIGLPVEEVFPDRAKEKS